VRTRPRQCLTSEEGEKYRGWVQGEPAGGWGGSPPIRARGRWGRQWPGGNGRLEGD
jgi:hypothetical protein